MPGYPDISPVAFQLGPLAVHWYGIMYLLGFAAAWLLAIFQARRQWSPVEPDQVEDLIFHGAVGVIVGGRLGYVLFYNMPQFLANPLWLFHIRDGGMSFHGGLIGVAAALALFAHRRRLPYLAVADFVAPLAPIGLGLGRLGNFIGQELWGRPTDGPWGMIFPRDPEGLARHPSQLYEFALEGVALFALLFWLGRRRRAPGFLSALFLLGYSLARMAVEFVREPDSHIGFDLFGWISRGQILCLPMLMLGLWLLWRLRRAP